MCRSFVKYMQVFGGDATFRQITLGTRLAYTLRGATRNFSAATLRLSLLLVGLMQRAMHITAGRHASSSIHYGFHHE